MINISFLYLQFVCHLPSSPFYTNTYTKQSTVSLIYNSRFSHYSKNIIYSNNKHHSTAIKRSIFSNILDTALVFSQYNCMAGEKCCISTSFDFQIGKIINNLIITNTSFPSSFANKNAFFEGECGDLKIYDCMFVCCYTTNSFGGALIVEQYCDVILHGCVFDQCHSYKHGCGAAIAKMCVVGEYIDNGLERPKDPAHELTKKVEIQYTCFQNCYSDDGNNLGTAVITGAEEAAIQYTSTFNCPIEGAAKSYSSQIDIQANTISAQYINATSGNSVYTGAIEFRDFLYSFFRFYTIIKMTGKYAISLITNANPPVLQMSSCNFYNNTIYRDSNYDQDTTNSIFPALIYIYSLSDTLIEKFCFSQNDYGVDGKFVGMEFGDEGSSLTLLNCYADTSDQNKWYQEHIMTSDCIFDDSFVQTLTLQQLKLALCDGEVEPAPIAITAFFTQSSDFSSSQKFTETDFFSPSSDFSSSQKFTETIFFTPSSDFSDSYFFSSSGQFSMSDDFTSTFYFTNSVFFIKNLSKTFSPTDSFTSSIQFTYSNEFSQSDEFTNSFSFYPTPTQSNEGEKMTIFNSFSLTYVMRKSVSISLSCLLTDLYSLTYNNEINDYTYIHINTNTNIQIPYIIHFYSPTFIQIEVMHPINDNKQKITPEQLIGIVCGSVAVFFSILGIILLSVRKKNTRVYSDDLDDSSEYEIKIQQTNENQVNFDMPVNRSNIDDWL